MNNVKLHLNDRHLTLGFNPWEKRNAPHHHQQKIPHIAVRDYIPFGMNLLLFP